MTLCCSEGLSKTMIPMNEYERASKKRNEDTLFPLINPSQAVRRDVWSSHHSNRFWDQYLGESKTSCPFCRSLEYDREEREIIVNESDDDTVLLWVRCLACEKRWIGKRYTKLDYEP